MEEKSVMFGIFFIAVLSFSLVATYTSGGQGAAVADTPYLTCFCDILAKDGIAAQSQYALFRSQLQTFADDCSSACKGYYEGHAVFAEDGAC